MRFSVCKKEDPVALVFAHHSLFFFSKYLAIRGRLHAGALPLLFCLAGARSRKAGGADSVKP
jgi:hypothetical protein